MADWALAARLIAQKDRQAFIAVLRRIHKPTPLWFWAT